jgi:hypothetical protein
MADERMRAVLVRYYEEIWNQGRLEVCDEVIAPDYVNHSAPLPDLPPGPGGLKQTVAAVRRAFPDVHYTIGVAPTGRSIEVQELQIKHLRDGQIVTHWHQIDDVGMQRQLGLLPH